MSTDGVLGAAYLPTDGYIDPSQLTFALAEGARRRGAEVDDVDAGHGRSASSAAGSRRRDGPGDGRDRDRRQRRRDVRARDRGARGRHRADRADGARVPRARAAGLPLGMPTMRDPSLLVYFRPESGGLIMGGYERHCAPWWLDGIPADFNGKLLDEDWPRFEELMENAIVRVPSLAEMGVVKLINGPEAFTPDGEFILGPSDVRGFWVAAGFCAHGLAGAGGMGRLVAEWIVEGTPSLDVWHMDSRRFGAAYRSREYTLARTKRGLRDVLRRQVPGARARGRAAAARLGGVSRGSRELGAVFGEKSGWERANWFEPNAARGDESLRPRGWAGKLWSPAIGAEHRACREAAAIFDESSFAKLEVVGRGRRRVPRGAVRQPRRARRRPGHVHADAQPRAAGSSATSPSRGSQRTGSGSSPARRSGSTTLAWIRQHAPDDGSVHVADVTSAYACLGLWGPASRAILQPLTVADARERRVPVHDRARARGRTGAVPRRAGHLRRRARLGALLPDRVRRRLWDKLWEARAAARPRRRRLQGDRLAAPREGLPRLGRGHLARGHAVRGRARLRGEARQGRLRRPRGARRRAGARASAAVPRPRRSACGRARLGARPRRRRARRARDERRLRLHRRRVDRVRLSPGRARRRDRGRRRDLRDWVEGAVAAEPLFDPAGERIRA